MIPYRWRQQMYLLLHFHWLEKLLNFIAQIFGFCVLLFGVCLIVFCTVVSAHVVLPVLAPAGTAVHYALEELVVVVSFCILFNYVSCATFSSRIGRVPQVPLHNPREPWQSDGSAGKDSVDFHGSNQSSAAAAAAVMMTRIREGDVFLSGARLSSGNGQARALPGSRWQSSGWVNSYSVRHNPGLLGFLPCRGCGAHMASPAQLRELERVAAEGERYGPVERRYKLLDHPRRFCVECNRLKAPREHHCMHCNACVPKMDHHCPWINNCVDVENHRYFFLFVLWLSIGAVLETGFLSYGMWRQHRYESSLKAAGADGHAATAMPVMSAPFGPHGKKFTSMEVATCLALSGCVSLFIICILFKLFTLALTNTTMIEEAIVGGKQQRVYGMTSVTYRNPYDIGAFQNLLSVFSTIGDPLLAAGVAKRPADPVERLLEAQQKRGLLLRLLQQCFLLAWTALVPTIRPTGSDGIHYATLHGELTGDEADFSWTLA